MSERLCVVMPVYNEQEAIGGVLQKWSVALSALKIDFVIRPYNDGSKDHSLGVMRDFVAAHPDSHVEVRDKPNGGHGNTILTGYRDAAADGFDWIFQIDSDDEMGPERFEELWKRRDDYDFLVGIRDGRIQALPRKIISFVSRCCVKLFYGCKTIWDVNTPYRLMRTIAFKDVYAEIPLATFAPNVIISGMVACKGLRFFETRVPQHDRTTGEVSIKKWKLLKAAAKSFCQTILFALARDKSRLLVGFVTGLTVAVSFFAFHSNPFFGVELSDSAVFAYIGKHLLHGSVPYVDMFDHKGPLLYLIIALGSALTPGSLWGLWLVEILFFICGLFAVRKMVRPYVNEVMLPVITIAHCVLFHIFAGGGCRCETYIYFFGLMSIAVFLGMIAENDVTHRRLMILGGLTAAILMIKFNMAVMILPVGLFLVHRGISERNPVEFARKVFFFAVGLACAVAPLLIYLGVNGAIGDFWDCYVKFNYEYRKFGGAHSSLTIPIIGVVALSLISLCVGVWTTIGCKRKMLYWSGAIMLLYIGVFGLSTPQHNYFLPVLSSMILPLSVGLSVAYENLLVRKIGQKAICMLGLVAIALIVSHKNIDAKAFLASNRGTEGKCLGQVLKRSCNEEVLGFKDMIPPEASNSVWVVGNDCWCYLALGVRPETRYIYTNPIYLMPGHHSEQIFRDLELAVNQYVILQREFFEGSYLKNPRCKQFIALLKKSYFEIAETPSKRYALYQRISAK